MTRIWTGTLAVTSAVLIAACGGDEGGDANTDRFDGAKADVASVVDRLGEAARAGDVKTICEDLVTPELQKSVREASGTSCADEFRENIVSEETEFRVESVEVRNDTATADVVDQADQRSEITFVRTDEDWRIARIR